MVIVALCKSMLGKGSALDKGQMQKLGGVIHKKVGAALERSGKGKAQRASSYVPLVRLRRTSNE